MQISQTSTLLKKQVNNKAIKGHAFLGERHHCEVTEAPRRKWKNQSCTHTQPCSAILCAGAGAETGLQAWSSQALFCHLRSNKSQQCSWQCSKGLAPDGPPYGPSAPPPCQHHQPPSCQRRPGLPGSASPALCSAQVF